MLGFLALPFAVQAADDDDDDAPAAEHHENKAASGAAKATAAGNWWHPRPGTTWQIQYTGDLDTSLKVDAYNIDLFDIKESTIKDLHGRGIKVICYFSAGSYEDWRPDARQFPKSVLGSNMTGWKGEKWLDIRKLDLLRPIMKARIDLAAQKGCDAVDPDNVEGFENKSGFPLKYGDQIAYNKMIADLAHKAGLAVSLKNDLSQVDDLVDYFDFQVNEECFEYDSCQDLIPFIEQNKPVFNIEYKVPTKSFCAQANKMNFDSLRKKLELDAWREACR